MNFKDLLSNLQGQLIVDVHSTIVLKAESSRLILSLLLIMAG